MKNYFKKIVISLFCSLILWIPVYGSEKEDQSLISQSQLAVPTAVMPFDVLTYVDQVVREVESIRFEMGKPKVRPLNITVTDATPREVLFQAITMFRKADQLAFELTATKEDLPKVSLSSEISDSDVLAVITAAMNRILSVKHNLNIEEESSVRSILPVPTTLSDVFYAIMQANRMLNVMVEQRITPSDVFQQVTLAIHYAARLLSIFPDSQRIPEPPPFMSGKQPTDVYGKLFECYQILLDVADYSNIKMLQLQIPASEMQDKTPSDVYDVASLLVSELSYFHFLLPNMSPPAEAYYPGRKFPSHVFQRAEMLKTQLLELRKRTQKNPYWIIGKHGQ